MFSAEADTDPQKAEYSNCFIIHAKYKLPFIHWYMLTLVDVQLNRSSFIRCRNYSPFSPALPKQLSWRNLVPRPSRMPSLSSGDILYYWRHFTGYSQTSTKSGQEELAGGFEPIRKGELFWMNNSSFRGTQLQSVIVNHHSFYPRTWTHSDLCYVPEVPSFNNSLVDGVSGLKEM